MVEIRLKKNNTVCEFQLNLTDITLPKDLETLKDLEKEVKNSILQLKKSNDEIKNFDPDGKDKDLLAAFNENIIALTIKDKRLELIRSEIHKLGTEQILTSGKVSSESAVQQIRSRLKKQENYEQNITYLENTSDVNVSNSFSEKSSEVATDVETQEKKNYKDAKDEEEQEEDATTEELSTIGDYSIEKKTSGTKRKTKDINMKNENDISNDINNNEDAIPIECEKRKRSVTTSEDVTKDGLFI